MEVASTTVSKESFNLDLLEIKERKNTTPDKEYWGSNPPDEIIFATGSIRKAIDLQVQVYGLVFPGDSEDYASSSGPKDFYEYINSEISNGDGALKEKTLIGYWHGVPIYAEPSPGETKDNDPVEQSDNKVEGLIEKYKGMNVIIIGLDTVDTKLKDDDPDKFDWDWASFKPMNSDNFPHDGSEEELVIFWEEYIKENYPDLLTIFHINSVSILNMIDVENVGTENNVPFKIERFLTVFGFKIIQEKLKGAQGSPDSGGGGLIQKIIEWEDRDALLAMYAHFPEGEKDPLKEYYETLDLNTLKWRIICEVMGAPYMVFKYLDEVVENRKTLEKKQIIFDAKQVGVQF